MVGRRPLTQPLRSTSGNNSVPPAMLGLKEYLSSREEEIHQVFGRRAAGGSLQFPVRSLRRRIRSARPRGRLSAAQMARLLEKRAYASRSPQRRSRKARWRTLQFWKERGVLATHIWHAKRFEMVDGIPMRVRDKGERAVHRIASHKCVVMDRSSWPCIEVQCNTSEELNEVLGCGLRTSISLTMGMFAPEGRLRAAALLLGDEGEVLSPIYVMREENPAGKAFIWVHPSATEHLESLLMGKVSSVTRLKPLEMSWFALEGPRARETVMRALDIEASSTLGGIVQRGAVHVVTTSHGCDVIVSDGMNAAFRKLVFAGASAIGQDDWEKLHRGVPCFPMDYPDSAACRRRSAEQAKTLLERQLRRPGALKGESLAIESPLFTDWSLLADLEGLALPRVARDDRAIEKADLVCVRLRADARGVPSALAHLYATTEEDEGESTLYQSKGESESIRPLIGFVTSGGFGYHQGCGIAIGFIKASFYGSMQTNKIWFRNVTSRHYHRAVVKRLGRWEGTDSFLSGLNVVST